MISYLIKSTNEFRLDTIQEVEEFHSFLQEKSSKEGYVLTSFSWSEKEVNSKNEEYSYFQVKCSFIFNKLKDPQNPFFKVEFPKLSQSDQVSVEQDESVEEDW